MTFWAVAWSFQKSGAAILCSSAAISSRLVSVSKRPPELSQFLFQPLHPAAQIVEHAASLLAQYPLSFFTSLHADLL
jgi:hypothetical protein